MAIYLDVKKSGQDVIDVNGDGKKDRVSFKIEQTANDSVLVTKYVDLADTNGEFDSKLDETRSQSFPLSNFPTGWMLSDAKFEEGKLKLLGRVSGEQNPKVKEIAWSELHPTHGVYGALRNDSILGADLKPLEKETLTSGYGSGGGEFGAKGESLLGKTAGSDHIILGAMDKSLIDAVIKRNMAQIRYVYQRASEKYPGLGGKVTIKFVIARDGSVTKAEVKSSEWNIAAAESEVNNGISSLFLKFQFPEPKGGGIVIVSYPFVFSPG